MLNMSKRSRADSVYKHPGHSSALLMRLLIGCAILLIILISAFPLATSAVSATLQVQATSPTNAQPVAIYFFWGDGCPHCAKAKPFLATVAQRYPTVEVRAYEVWYNVENQQLFAQMTAAYGFEPSGVPTIFMGERLSDVIGKKMEVNKVDASVLRTFLPKDRTESRLCTLL